MRAPRVRNAIMADTLFAPLRVIQTILTSVGSTPSAAGQYSKIQLFLAGNDITDPFLAFGADTPVGMAQYANFYRNNIVHSSSLQVTPLVINSLTTNPVTNSALPYQITVVPMTSTATALIPMDEQPYARTKQFNVGDQSTGVGLDTYTGLSAQAGNDFKASVYNVMMTKKMLGYKNLADEKTTWSTVTTGSLSSPSAPWYWCIEIKSLIPWDGTTVTASVTLGKFQLRVQERFKTQFLNRYQLLDVDAE